ncbi:MAG: SDR family NAD(P)-dependent oxidoreductase [Hyphomicrobium sp.]
MFRLASAITSPWINRYNRDTPARREARAVVATRLPAVVISGASRGIGLAMTRVFLAAGNPVLMIARNQAGLDAALAQIDAHERERCFTLALDITLPQAAHVIDDALLTHGCYLDILVNNAAIGLSGPFATHKSAELDALVALNIAALTHLTHHALHGMLARGSGGIISMASLGGYVPGPHQAAYYASKAYVLSLSEALACEVSGRGVKLCAVAPGPVGTTFHEEMHAETAPYRKILPELSPDRIARSAYRAFTLGQRVVVPGVLYRLFFISLRVLPHPISVPMTRWLLKNWNGPRK